jgi:hypothetical protein
MHLAESHPQSGLLPAPRTLERTECYKWISFILTELDAPLCTIAKHRFGLPMERRAPPVIETAGWEFGNAVELLASGVNGRPFLAGASLSVADILAGHVLLWVKSARLPPGSDAPEIYLQSLLGRDAFKRASSLGRKGTGLALFRLKLEGWIVDVNQSFDKQFCLPYYRSGLVFIAKLALMNNRVPLFVYFRGYGFERLNDLVLFLAFKKR